MQWWGYVALFGFLGFVVLNIVLTRKYLQQYVAVYKKAPPTWGWITERDADPIVERIRVQRLAVVVTELALFAIAMVWLLNGF